MEVCQWPRRLVIADDQRKVTAKLSRLVTVEQVCQAVEVMGDEDGNILRRGREGEPPVHLKFLGQRSEGGVKVGLVAMDIVGGELDAHKKESKLDILVLIGIKNIGVVLLNQKVGDSGHETFTVGAVDQKSGGLGHGNN